MPVSIEALGIDRLSIRDRLDLIEQIWDSLPEQNKEHVFDRMKAEGVLVKNFSGGHPLLENCLRLTVGTPEENRSMLRALKVALS